MATLWLAVVGVGFASAWRYEATPGRAAAASDWPTGGPLVRETGRPTIVTFVHPDCPCSRVGLQQLAELVRSHAGAAGTTVVIVGAPGLERLEQGVNARTARTIPDARIVLDPKGEEARRFGAETSGQTFAFSPEGRLLFRGGVTASRGHAGPNAGIDALEAILEGRPTNVTTPVYGCALRSEGFGAEAAR